MRLTILLLSVVLEGCASGQLMRCAEPADENVWHCPKEAEAPYYFCKKRTDILKCEAPK